MNRHVLACKELKHLLKTGSAVSAGAAAMHKFLSGGHDDKATQEAVRLRVLQFFIAGNIPFLQANNEHFQQLLEWIIPGGGQISRKTIRTSLSIEAAAARQQLKATLIDNDSKVSLALDCWTSRTGHAFLGTCSVNP
jgi:hypothetical protein